jgi:riboflavin kinase/FMN adenylyltransferase
MSIEVHIFNYSNFDLYAQFIEVEFVDYVRNEKKFKNKEELKLQLIKDKQHCKSLQI